MAEKGVKTVKVNLNVMLKNAMHLPRTKSGYTLYTHVKTFKDDGTSGDIIETGALADPIYAKLKDVTYNSPKNIRRLFITGSKVYVQYYTSPFKDGSQSQGTWEERSLKMVSVNKEYNDDTKNLFDIAKGIVDYTENLQLYMNSQLVDKDTELPNKYDFKLNNTNNLFKALSNGWVTSNIEEFYVDWTALMPEEVFMHFGNSFRSSYDVVKFFTTTNNNSIEESGQLKELVRMFNAANIKDIHTRYPRLRKVALIQNLDAIMTNPQMNKANANVDSDFDNAVKTWFSVNMPLIQSVGGAVKHANFSGSPENYKTAESQYLFDSTLKIWFETYLDKFKKARRKATFGDTYSNEEEATVNIEIGEVEQRLIDLEASLNNTSAFNQLLRLSVLNFTPSELKQLFSTFSKVNRDKYADIIGIKF